jgi:RHS repeat-associated protein
MALHRHLRTPFLAAAVLCAYPNNVLANYTYDALGRRITFNDPVAATTTRYYYDGQSVIEERNAGDVRVRYHVNGAQYIDERVATFTDASAAFAYYLGSNSFSITGTGNADGTIVERLDYSSTGDFAGGGPGASSFHHDADHDLDLDLRDFANFQNCFGQTTGPCLAIHDFDTSNTPDGDIDLNDYARWSECSHGPFVTPDQTCGIPTNTAALPVSGTFTLHGRPVDVLSDGHAILDFRSRLYDPVLGRFLQRDPLQYSEGPGLYEAFRSNSLRFTDPFGRQAEEPGMLESVMEFLRRFQSGADPFTGENLLDKALRRAGAVDEPNPYRRAFLEQVDLYQDVTFATIQAAEPVVARGVGVVQVAGGVAEASTGVVLVVVSEGLGAAPGTVFVLHGVDVTQSGVRQVISGRFTPTETYTVIAEAGYPTTALVVDVGISLSSGISAAGLAAEATIPIRGIGTTVRVAEPQTIIPLTVTSPQIVLQRLTAQESTKLAEDLSRALTVLQPRELAAAQARPDVARLFYGKAVERLVARGIRRDPLLRTLFDPSGIGRRGPDVFGIGSAQGLRYDITTANPRAIAEHLRRPYGRGLIIITYERPVDFVVFPP